jgi:nucleoside-triphosphatase THEP1
MKSGKLALISGASNSGKTTYLDAVVRRALAKEATIGGLLSHGLWRDGGKAGFILESAATGERRQLADTRPLWEPRNRYGRFYFSPETIEWGNAVLETGAGSQLVVVDEWGPLELSGGGLWPGIDFLLRRHSGVLLITVRPGLLEDVRKQVHSMME